MSSVLRNPTRRLLGVLLLVLLFIPFAVQIANARGSKSLDPNPTYVEQDARDQDELPGGDDGDGCSPEEEPEGDPDDFGLWIPEILISLLTQVYLVMGR